MPDGGAAWPRCDKDELETPTAPSAVVPPPAPAPPPAPSPAPAPTTPAFVISLPIRAADRATNAFGLNPFGIHIGDHGIDGHPGWDIEYRPGTSVLAAAAGTIQSVLPSEGGQSFGIQIAHTVGGRQAYRTIYGVGTLAPGVSAGATVSAGQPLGTVAAFTRTIGTITVTYGFTHFQLDDFSRNVGLTNTNAVSPETFLSGDVRQLFNAIWSEAFYIQEFVEPFPTNPRDVAFPMTRSWLRQSGDLAMRLEFTRADAFDNDFAYLMRDGAGAVVERGRVQLEALAKPHSLIDFLPAGGAPRRRGLYSILDGIMRLDYGMPGAGRSPGLDAAATYTTTP